MRLTERKWLLVTPQLLTANGTKGGVVTIDDTSLFRVKQKVELKSLTQSPTEQNYLEIKRILSHTQMIIGPGNDITAKENLEAFLVSDLSTIESREQSRTSIDGVNIERGIYEEEPVLAKRVLLVDKWGDRVDEDNPLPVLATIQQDYADTPLITNLDLPDKTLEYSFALPVNTMKFRFKARNNSKIQWSFVTGTTNTNYLTLLPGNTYVEEGVKLPSSILYFRASQDDELLEILTWT